MNHHHGEETQMKDRAFSASCWLFVKGFGMIVLQDGRDLKRWLIWLKLRPYFVSPQILAGKYTEVGDGAFMC